jgi:hypothetical protein
MDDSLFPAHHKNMQPGSIAELIRRYADLLEEGMKELKEEVGSEGKEVDFGDRMFDILVSILSFLSPLLSPSPFSLSRYLNMEARR